MSKKTDDELRAKLDAHCERTDVVLRHIREISADLASGIESKYPTTVQVVEAFTLVATELNSHRAAIQLIAKTLQDRGYL